MSQEHNENTLNNYWDKPDGCDLTIANLVFTEVARKKIPFAVSHKLSGDHKHG